MKSQFSLLTRRRFLPLFVTQFLGAFNDNVFKNALVILATFGLAEKAGLDARLLVTAAAGIFILPFFLFSATAGQLADRFEKAALTRLIKLAEIAFMILGAAGFFLENIWILMSVLFLMGAHSAFFGPIKYSILPDHLKEDELIAGNGMVEAGTFLAILTGTIVGGVLILLENGPLVVSLIMIAAALAGFLSSREIPKAGPAAPRLKINLNFLAETWHIVNHTRQKPAVFLSIIGISWFWLVGFTFLAQFPVFAKDVIGGNEHVVTLFLTAFSIGIVIGSLVCNRMLKGKISGDLAHIGAFGMSIFIAALYLSAPPQIVHEGFIGVIEFLSQPRHWAVAGSLMMIAVFGGIYIVPLYAIMQSRSDEGHRSRTIAANNIMNALFMVVGAAATMVMLELHLKITDIFLALAIVNIPVGILVRRTVKRVRKHAA